MFGGLTTIPDAVDHFSADTVAVLSCPEMDGTRLRQLGWDLETTGTDLYVAPALMDVAGPRTTIRPVAGLPAAARRPGRAGRGQADHQRRPRPARRRLALLMLAPAFAVIAVAIRATDHGPVFFRQTRVGKNGGTFQVWKFRTMVVDAEARQAHLAELNETAGGVLFKMRRDPRITQVGGWLRRWSLDELPQLINVMTGDMSLVGPRPGAAVGGGEVRPRHAAAGSRSSPVSPACGRSADEPTCPMTRRSGSTSATWRTGPSRSICRSCGRRVPP